MCHPERNAVESKDLLRIQLMASNLWQAVGSFSRGEALTTASGFVAPGKLSSGQFSAKNGRQPRATNRNERAAQWAVATIEVAGNVYGHAGT